MRKVYQTKFGGKDHPIEERGNCHAACIASIFELDLEDVPDVPYCEPFWEEWDRWLEERGLTSYHMTAWADHEGPEPNRGYTIATVPSQRLEGQLHAVVAKDGEIVHDPREGNRPYSPEEVIDWMIFVILDPGRPILREVYKAVSGKVGS